jgi:hypothetical protein
MGEESLGFYTKSENSMVSEFVPEMRELLRLSPTITGTPTVRAHNLTSRPSGQEPGAPYRPSELSHVA